MVFSAVIPEAPIPFSQPPHKAHAGCTQAFWGYLDTKNDFKSSGDKSILSCTGQSTLVRFPYPKHRNGVRMTPDEILARFENDKDHMLLPLPSCFHAAFGISPCFAVVFKTSKGQHKDRIGLTCPMSGSDKCGYFYWLDEVRGSPMILDAFVDGTQPNSVASNKLVSRSPSPVKTAVPPPLSPRSSTRPEKTEMGEVTLETSVQGSPVRFTARFGQSSTPNRSSASRMESPLKRSLIAQGSVQLSVNAENNIADMFSQALSAEGVSTRAWEDAVSQLTTCCDRIYSPDHFQAHAAAYHP